MEYLPTFIINFYINKYSIGKNCTDGAYEGIRDWDEEKVPLLGFDV